MTNYKQLTITKAKELTTRQLVYFKHEDDTMQRWRVNGKVKLWKTRPTEIKIPLKHGLYTHGYLTQDNLHKFYLEEEI